MPIALLLAMQASGMIIDWLGTKQQAAMMKQGADLEQQQITSNIEQTRLQTEDASLAALQNLRKTLGIQAAVFASRGTSQSAGSAVLFGEEAKNTFEGEEKMRRMNLLSNETALKAKGAISKLNATGENSKLWSSFASRSINRFPTNPSAYGEMGKSFGLTQGT